MNECVVCGAIIPEGRHICFNCELEGERMKIKMPPSANVKLSFGDEVPNFIITFYRSKPLNKFQIWMYKICFGITAKNLKGEIVTWA